MAKIQAKNVKQSVKSKMLTSKGNGKKTLTCPTPIMSIRP